MVPIVKDTAVFVTQFLDSYESRTPSRPIDADTLSTHVIEHLIAKILVLR